MLATAHAGCLVGIEAKPVQVEVRLGKDLPGMEVVGLPDRGVREARVRVRAALESEGFALPERSFVLNLAPGDLRKDGASFDLAIAVSLLVACDLARDHRLHDTLFVGELGLSGELRAVRGVLPQLRSAAARGLRRAIVPAPNQAEAALASGIEVLAARYLHEVAEWLDGERELPRVETREAASHIPSPVDLREVRGQPASCRGLE
ncbi:MAG: hypothetical protein OEY14_10325, partial [Myxococcales bacterium]|nr:hypothetical protein [Myxococcales bacterium]